MSDQLATRAVDVLAAIRAIAPSFEHPMCHIACALQREAEKILQDAFVRATELTYLAAAITKDYDKATKEGFKDDHA